MSFIIYPLPTLFKDWKQWGQLLVQALNKQQGGAGSSSNGIPTAFNGIYGGTKQWPTLSPGEFMVETTGIKINSLVFVFPQSPPNGFLYEDISKRVAGHSFVIKSTDPTDTPDIAWVIFQPV